MGFCKAYPDQCRYCYGEVCECPATVPSTVGRLGGAIPPTRFEVDGKLREAFMSVDEPSELFGL